MSFLKNIGSFLIGGSPLAIAKTISDQKASITTSKELQALANVRVKFPGPDKCALGTEKLPVYLGNGTWNDSGTPCGDKCTYITNALYSMQGALDDWHIPRGEAEYIKAYNLVMSEYKQYYMENCVAATDPVLDSAVVPDGGIGATPAATAAGTPATPAATTTSSVVDTIKTAANKQLIKGVPNWALW